jgi:hypothetical protein
LDIPDSIGIKLTGKSGIYGKAYFEQGVIMSNNTQIISGGSAYYFKKHMDDGKNVGFDLLDWYNDKNGYTHNYDYGADDFILINSSSDTNAAIPNPQDNITYIWDW